MYYNKKMVLEDFFIFNIKKISLLLLSSERKSNLFETFSVLSFNLNIPKEPDIEKMDLLFL